MNYQALIWKLIQSYYFVRLFRKLFQDCKCKLRFLMPYYFIFLIKRDCYYIYRQSPYAFEPLPLKSEFRTAMLLDPNETANWIPYVIPLGPTTESHIIRYLFPERSLGRVPVDLAFATTMHLPFNESIFPENSGICALLFNRHNSRCICK